MKTYTQTILLFFFLFGYIISNGQPGFNMIHDLGLPTNHLRKMLVHDDTIIGYGLAYPSDTVGSRQGLLLTKFDSNGVLLKSNLLLEPFGDFYSIGKNWGGITVAEGGGYAMTASALVGNSAWLIKVDQDLEVEFIKEYPDSVNASNFNYSILEINDGYILYGEIQDSDLVLRPFVRKVDKDGEIVWHKYYGNPSHFGVVTDVKMLNDSVIVAGSYEWTTTNVYGPISSVFYYLDMEGEIIERWESEPDGDIGLVYGFLPVDGGGLIIFGQSIVGQTSGGTPIVQATLSQMDEDFNIQWIRKFGKKGTYSAQFTFRDIEPTIDGNYIVAGESFTVVNGDERGTGWLMKFSPEGDSIWSRQVLPPFPPDLFNDQFFGGVGVLSSGSIVAGGSANDHGERSIWLVKVGNDGCMETYSCGLVVTGVEEEVREGKGGMLVYPNPASSTVTIGLEETISSTGMVLFLNAQGREVLKEMLPTENKVNTFSVANLPSGLYYIEVRDKDQNMLQQSKLIINH